MTLKDKVLPPDFVPDEAIVRAIREHLANEMLPCAAAFGIVADLNCPPLLIGQTADALQIHLSHCQLGLFGYPEHAKGWTLSTVDTLSSVDTLPEPDGLREAIRQTTQDGILACPAAWKLAARFGISKLLVGYVADQMGVHMARCQLGVF